MAFTFSPEGVSKDIYVRQSSGVGDSRALVSNPNLKRLDLRSMSLSDGAFGTND